MRLLFTTNQLPLAQLIRWGLQEPVSHFGILFDEKLVFHSNLVGVHITGIYQFSEQSKTIFSLDIDLTVQQEEDLYQTLLTKYEGRPYNYLDFWNFSKSAFMHRFFGKPLEVKSDVSNSAFLCVGLAEAIKETQSLPGWLTEALSEVPDLDMISPFQLYLKIKEAQERASAQKPS